MNIDGLIYKRKFSLGHIIMTTMAYQAYAEAEDAMIFHLMAHAQGDWGEICDEDKARNESAAQSKGMVMSVRTLTSGQVIWIITDPGHEVTTLLTPDEY